MDAATIKMFLPLGDPKRLRTVELSNWTGKAVAGPRSEFDKILSREESLSTGVYFLSGTDPETNKHSIYIGEAECIKDRIKSHLSKDFWNNICFFVTKDDNLTKAHIRYLEGRLIELAKEANRSVIMNNQSSGSRLPESDREDMEVFLAKMQQILPVLGIESFVQARVKESDQSRSDLLYCKIKNITATGYLTPNGLLVLSGSQAVLQERSSAKNWPSVLVQRNKLIEEKILVQKNGAYEFEEDTEFSSPSSAAAVIHGGSANGLIAWVNKDGKKLKDIQNSED